MPDGQCILRRRLAKNGRSQAWINDIPVTVSALQQAADYLVEIRAQHESMRMGDVARQMELLDGYGNLEALAQAYREVHERCLAQAHDLEALESGERNSLKELDYLRYQAQEFKALAPQVGDLTALEQRFALLSSAEVWRQRAEHATAVLTENEKSVLRMLGGIAKSLQDAPDERLQKAAQACAQALECTRDASAECQAAAEHIQSNPQALKRLEEQRDIWYDLMRKHGDGEAAIISAWASIEARISSIEGLDEKRDALRKSLGESQQQRQDFAEQLRVKRQASFKRLGKAVSKELADLGMPKTQLELSEEPLTQPGPHGLVLQEIMVATNPGLPPDKLRNVASGGEAARLSLAFAIVLSAQDNTPVLIFDEVDSGVGGRLGAVIGSKLAALARDRTVLVITHTPQVAAAASKHYTVHKHQLQRRTDVTVVEVVGEQRLIELSDMLGGGAAALNQAKSLLGASV
jgi:DNA repair protein RecN (Recombination protein N)